MEVKRNIFQLNDLSLKPITGISNELIFIDKIMEPNYRTIEEFINKYEPPDYSDSE